MQRKHFCHWGVTRSKYVSIRASAQHENEELAGGGKVSHQPFSKDIRSSKLGRRGKRNVRTRRRGNVKKRTKGYMEETSEKAVLPPLFQQVTADKRASLPVPPHTPLRRSLKEQILWKKQGKNHLAVLSSVHGTSRKGPCRMLPSCRPSACCFLLRCCLEPATDLHPRANLSCGRSSNNYQSLSLIKLCYY